MAQSVEALFDPNSYPIEMITGRDIGAGYMRGCGLEFWGLYPRLESDPIFAKALAAAWARGSLLHPHKLANLYLMVRYGMKDDRSNIFEFGSYMGGSAVFMGSILKALGRKGAVYAFDTFEGMPETDPIRDHHRAGDFADAGYQELLGYIEEHGLAPYVKPVKGLFDLTLPAMLPTIGDVGLIHIDCDIYEPIKYLVNTTFPKLSTGTYVVFDDPLFSSCLGAFDAVQESVIRGFELTAEQVYPHLVFRYPAL
ncbi:hypothetical protein GCM10028797_10660 [Dyella agri]